MAVDINRKLWALKKGPTGSTRSKILLYEKIIALFPEVERKGDTIPYTSHNGNMFSYLSKEGVMALRLPEKERENFLKKHHAKLMENYGIIQKEYVAVPDSLLANTTAMKKYFEWSYEYVKSLKPKPTTRKSPKKAAKKTKG